MLSLEAGLPLTLTVPLFSGSGVFKLGEGVTRIPSRGVYYVGVVIRRVERYDLVKIKPTESEAEH